MPGTPRKCQGGRVVSAGPLALPGGPLGHTVVPRGPPGRWVAHGESGDPRKGAATLHGAKRELSERVLWCRFQVVSRWGSWVEVGESGLRWLLMMGEAGQKRVKELGQSGWSPSAHCCLYGLILLFHTLMDIYCFSSIQKYYVLYFLLYMTYAITSI